MRAGGHTRAVRALLFLACAAAAAGAAAVLAASAASGADTTPPAVIWLAPHDGGFVSASSIYPNGQARVEVTAQLNDQDSRLNPLNVTVAIYAGDSTAPLQDDYNSSGPLYDASSVQLFALYYLDDGPYRLVLVATDDAGNSLTRNSTFTVDLEPPVLEVAAPNSTNESTIHVRVDARDNGSGIELPVILSYRTACAYTWDTVQVDVIELPGRVVGDAVVPVCTGANNQFSVVVNDRAGNTATISKASISYDREGPTFGSFDPKSFSRVDGPNVVASVTISDDASGVDPARVEYRVSPDGGVTWSGWSPASGRVSGRSWRANATLAVPDGATVALEWRAWDKAGNGPNASRTEFFYTNGPPFLETFVPEDGTVVFEYNQVRMAAKADDPDADNVTVTVSSDIDGSLGPADGRPVRLSLGVHNLTVALDDHHHHIVRYVYQLQVVERPPPDPRPLLLTVILAGVMCWFAYAEYTKGEDEEEAAPA